LLSVDLTVK